MEKLLPKTCCTGGFEEQKNDTSMYDSPTCSREVLRESLTVFLSQS